MISASQINEIVSAYLKDGDVNRFVLAFSGLSYNIHKNGSRESIRLANEIECSLADLRGGFISKSIFQQHLLDLVKPSANVDAVLIFCPNYSVNETAVIENRGTGSAEFSDTLFAEGFA